MSLVRVGFIAVPPGAKPGFDHADVQRAGRRMYVAHTGADRVDVLDCARQTFLRSLFDLPGVAGVLIDEEHDLLFTSDRGAARVSVFRCSDERLIGRVAVGPHPNGLAYDRRRRRLYAFNLGEPLGENCTASVIELGSMQVAAELALPGRPRWALYDESRDRVYANIREPAQIVVIDPARTAIVEAFPVPSEGPHGLALIGDRLFCAADGAALVVLDANTGEHVDSLLAAGGARRRDARRRPAASLRRHWRTGRRLQLRHRAAGAPRDGRDRSRGAHDRLGSRWPPSLRLLPR